MRRIGPVALVLVTGCSLVWNMDPYEGGASGKERDGAASSSGRATSSSSSGGGSSSGSVSSTSSGGTTSGSIDFDAGDAAPLEPGTNGFDASFDSGAPCADEDETNDTPSFATAPAKGTTTCGVIDRPADRDYFYIDAPAPKTIFIDLGVNVRVIVYYSDGTAAWSQTPGMKPVNLPMGGNMVRFEAAASQAGGSYTLSVP